MNTACQSTDQPTSRCRMTVACTSNVLVLLFDSSNRTTRYRPYTNVIGAILPGSNSKAGIQSIYILTISTLATPHMTCSLSDDTVQCYIELVSEYNLEGVNA